MIAFFLELQLSLYFCHLLLVSVIKWWRVKLGNNFTRVLSRIIRIFNLDRIDREFPSLDRLELKFGLSSEFFDKIPVRILHDVLFRVIRFSKVLFLRPGIFIHDIRELKNHDDGFVDDDRKWVTVYCASVTSKFRRRGVVDDAKQSRITSSCNPQASAGINPLF